jgi:hypothetical protein
MLGITTNKNSQEIELVFSENPIGFESGEPVYPVDTKVFVKSIEEKEFTISVNGGDVLKAIGSKVEITNYINPQADTYTVVVEAKTEKEVLQKIFGFSTK